ncbi:hypothetical protein CKM354_001261000 [Cercospora kikuchii]|uniref:Uncharacterized protein n=1 Tax=Cercospora kikuchii TaxID=84275 RepID=A0A9P3FMA4_9PEZI|nr:uncharacterized protein CKM354_001261000 [Cercospora kikuchii]GIZ49580.1 hypothetical protein CKM354_001261000 [Cercospora kikuchii]
MKGAISSVLLLASAVSAIAVAEPEAKKVSVPSKPKWQGKPLIIVEREADAKKIQVAKPRFGFCGVAGSNCKREADAEAEAKKIQVARPRFGFCGVAGSNCKRDAKKIQVAKPRFGFCGVAGSNCHRMKRSAEAIADAFAEADPKKIQVAKPRFGFCGVAGSNCKRDAKKIQVARPRFGFCGVAGSNCHKARRSLEAVGELAERSYEEIVAREAEAEADPKKIQVARPRFGFCGVAGSNCKRDAEADAKKIQVARPRFGFCGVAGSNCAMVKRNPVYSDEVDEQVTDVVNAINEWDPEYLSDLCHSEGGECAALIKARDAFQEIKRDVEEEQYKRGVEDFEGEYKRAEHEEGIEAQLDELEAALDDAVARL